MVKEIDRLIDQTILRPDASKEDIENFCVRSLGYEFASIFVHPTNLGIPFKHFRDRSTRVGTVVDFCFGAGTRQMKITQTKEVVVMGVDEIDTVINIGLIKSKRFGEAEDEIRSIVEVGRDELLKSGIGDRRLVIKVIIEAGLLSDQEKKEACLVVKAAGADYVKTSTGFFGSGAKERDVSLMRDTVGADFGVKASGGIRTLSQLVSMVKAGADRIGTSSGIEIISEYENLIRAGKSFEEL